MLQNNRLSFTDFVRLYLFARPRVFGHGVVFMIFLLCKRLQIDVSGGGSPRVGRQKVFPSSNSKGCLQHSLGMTQVATFCRPRKWLFLLIELCDFSGNNHILKVCYIINSENVWSGSKNDPRFSQTTHSCECCWRPKQCFISKKSI